tara:strand:+ start:896 stop:1234 length:339 start_codon:yes stop_codon:yes gene_type:complete
MNISLLKYKLDEINENWQKLSNTMNNNELYDESNTMNNSCGVISHLKDIEEIFDILNEKICMLNNKIELQSDIEISQYAIQRINNNNLVKNIIKPYLPFMMIDLVNNSTNIT